MQPVWFPLYQERIENGGSYKTIQCLHISVFWYNEYLSFLQAPSTFVFFHLFLIFAGSFQFHFFPSIFHFRRLLPIPVSSIYFYLCRFFPIPFSSTFAGSVQFRFHPSIFYFAGCFNLCFFPTYQIHQFAVPFQSCFVHSWNFLPGYHYGNALLPGTAGTRGTHFLSPWLGPRLQKFVEMCYHALMVISKTWYSNLRVKRRGSVCFG